MGKKDDNDDPNNSYLFSDRKPQYHEDINLQKLIYKNQCNLSKSNCNFLNHNLTS